MTEKNACRRGGRPRPPATQLPSSSFIAPGAGRGVQESPLLPLGWGGCCCSWPTSKPSKPTAGRHCPPRAGGAAGDPWPEPPQARTFPPAAAAGTEAPSFPARPPSHLPKASTCSGHCQGTWGLPPSLTPKPGALLLNSGGTRKQLAGTAEKSQVRPAPPAGGGAEIRAPLAVLVCNDSAKGARCPHP